jgi:type II secretory pathway pseudopilin PulG
MRRSFVKSFYRNRVVYGLTLVELLVVVGVVSLLTAIILPAVKTLLTDRKSSQSAIVVKNFFEAARARAIGKNRTVAVVLERLSSRAKWDPEANNNAGAYISETATSVITLADSNFVPYNACIRLSLAEEPAPITESMLSAPVVMYPRTISNPGIPNFPTDNYVDEDAVVDSHGGSEVRAFNIQGPEAALQVLARSLVSGSEISFGNSKRRFAIVSPRTPTVHLNFLAQHRNDQTPQGIWFAVVNELAADDSGERASPPYFGFGSGGFTSFKIYSRPKPIYSEMVQLPRGMCIDLSLSGFGNDTRRIDNATSPLLRPVIDVQAGPDDHPLSDYRLRFASDWIGNGTVPLPPQLRPVYISFSPDGSLSHVWANERSGSNLTRIDATQDIFLHIGKIDQIVMKDPAFNERNKASFLALRDSGIKQNLTDTNGYVIRLSPKSGSIIASPQLNFESQAIAESAVSSTFVTPAQILNSASLGDLIEMSRRGTYSSNVTAQ